MPDYLHGIEIDPKVFAKAIDRVVTDKDLQHKFKTDPTAALEALGIKIDDADRAKLVARDFASIAGSPTERLGQVAETYVKVGVEVAVGVIVGVASDQMINTVQKEVTRANLTRIQTAAKRRISGLG